MTREPGSRDHRVAHSAASASLRPIGLPRPVAVQEDALGLPATVVRAAAHSAHSAHAPSGTPVCVEQVEEVWRIAEAWWREAPQARTYYRVILEGGRPLTLFRDDTTGAWFEQSYSPPGREGAAR